jgi:hypothetical protein
LPLVFGEPACDDSCRPGVFTLVTDDTKQKQRRLPTLYLGTTPVFSDRSVARALLEFVFVVKAVVASRARATYLMRACEIDGRRGLYGLETHNRSSYQHRLARAGFRFAGRPFVTLGEQSTFTCDDWGEFFPDFIAFRYGEEICGVARVPRAVALFALASARLGRPAPEEVRRLVAVLDNTSLLASRDPDALVHSVRTWGA